MERRAHLAGFPDRSAVEEGRDCGLEISCRGILEVEMRHGTTEHARENGAEQQIGEDVRALV